MVRKTVVIAGLFLTSLAFVLDATATTAEACGGCRGCRRGCGYGGCGYGGCGYGGCGYGGCGYGGCGYSTSYYGGCGGGCYSSCGTACCSTPVYVAPTCCSYYAGNIYAPAYASAPRRQYYVSPALPVSTYGMPVAMPMGSVLRTSPVLVSYSR
jgi:hypothetical protein